MRTLTRWTTMALLLVAAPSFAAKTMTMSVQVKKGQLRSAPSYLSRVVTDLDYTTRVTVLEEKGDWLRVRQEEGAAEGWMHAATLTKTKLKLVSGNEDATTAVSSEEQALAGKGFNSDVEAQFKEQNAKANFAAVDKMEKIIIPAPKIVEFLEVGNVKAAKGGAE
jgi:uncharacterized protein YgiM (DUF1202 family)